MSDELAEGERGYLEQADPDQLKHSDLDGRIDGLRGMSWAYAVLFHTGYSASGASKRFSPTPLDETEFSNSKLMYQYLRGDRAPTRGPRGRYGFDLVAAVDSHHAGRHATRWLDHPIWQIFHPKTADRELRPYLDEEALNPTISQYLLDDEVSPETSDADRLSHALESFNFDGYIYVCAMLRAAHFAGLRSRSGRPLHFALLEYLTPHAARTEQVFGFVQAPFLRMVQDFYSPPKK